MNCYYKPVFFGPVTTSKGIKLYNAASKPEFFGGTKITEPVPLAFDTSIIRTAAYDNGKIFRDSTGSGKLTTVDLNFLSNGDVKYRLKLGTGIIPVTALFR